MKTLPWFLLLVALVLPAQAQKKISADELHGEWKLIIEMEDRAREADNALERAALRAAGSFLEEIDIRLLFEDEGVYRVAVTAFDEEAEIDEDEHSWSLTRHGGLLLSDTDQFQSGEDTLFFRVGDELVAFEVNEDGKPGARKNITLRRVDT